METFYTFWQAHYKKGSLPAQAVAFVNMHHSIQRHRRAAVVKFPQDPFPYFCIVLTGVVGGYQLNLSGKRILREVAISMDYFTGNEHTFSTHVRNIEFCCLDDCCLLLLPQEKARDGQQEHEAIAELFQVLKQRKILRLRKLVSIYQEENHQHRYARYAELLAELARVLSHQTQSELLHMSWSQYKKTKKNYLEALYRRKSHPKS